MSLKELIIEGMTFGKIEMLLPTEEQQYFPIPSTIVSIDYIVDSVVWLATISHTQTHSQSAKFL